MTEDDLLDAIGQREGRTYAEPPVTDQPTAAYGLTLPVVQAWFGQHPEWAPIRATVEILRSMPLTEAREIARWHLRDLGEREGFNQIQDEDLRLQCLDFAFNSGGPRAIRWLQRVLNRPRTGRMDRETIEALTDVHEEDATWFVHHALIAARVQMIHRAVAEGTIDKTFESGLLTRALSFSRLEVP